MRTLDWVVAAAFLAALWVLAAAFALEFIHIDSGM